MGAGKTQWAIQYMNQNPQKKFMYITPYNDEIQTRIIPRCPELKFKFAREGRKISDFKAMLEKGQNIVATHECFKRADAEVESLLEANDYTLIMDEVCDVVIDIQYAKADVDNILKSYGHAENGFLVWDDDTYPDFDGKHSEIKQMAKTGNLLVSKESFFLWLFPVEFFNKFSEVYVMTYLFPGQIQKYYFDIHGVDYKYFMVTEPTPEHYEIVPHDGTISNNLKPLINIYEGNLNNVGKKNNALSWNWCNNPNNRPKLVVLKNNLKNYFQHIINAKSNEIIWTCLKGDYVKQIKDYRILSQLKGDGYTKGFIAHNARATNKFKDRNCVAYCVNRFMRTVIKNDYFAANGIFVDEKLWALSEMLQLIWRSAIRDGHQINLYIPSKRMRDLLNEYLENKIDVDYGIIDKIGRTKLPKLSESA